jgi:heat-inducible transcriptional repressor
MPINLNQRHQQILWATIRHYIATAEPVGSKTLVDGYNLNVSPATIRNSFATLEKAGLLYQPHTSAGRVPSDSGYRLYVDHLIQPSPDVGRQVEELLSRRLDWESWSVETLLRGATQILANLSGYITMITLPQTSKLAVRHLQFVQVETTRVMLIVVLDSYQTESVLMQLPKSEEEELDPLLIDRELQILSNFLNSKLRGRSLRELSTLDWSELDGEFQHYVDSIGMILAELDRRTQPIHSYQIAIGGISEVLDQPEFSELQQVKTLLHLLESEPDRIGKLIFNPQPLEGDDRPSHPSDLNSHITIWIGAENPIEPMQTCTLISTTYQHNSIPVGSVGVLGPKRMLYENAIALVQAAADYLSDAIGQQHVADKSPLNW